MDDGRVAALQLLLSAFTRTMSRRETAELVLEHATELVGALSGSVQLVSADGTELEYVMSRGMGGVAGDAFARTSVLADLPASDALRSDRAVIIASADDLLGRYAEFAQSLPGIPRRTWLCMPLRADDRAFGVLTLGFAEGRTFRDVDEGYLAGFAQICAQALERARLFDEEGAARERNVRLQRVTAAFSRALTPDEVAGVGVSLGVEALGADGGCLMLLSEGRDSLSMIGASRLSAAERAELCAVDVPPFIAEAIATREPVFFERTDAAPTVLGRRRSRARANESEQFRHGTEAAIPLAPGGRSLGAMVFAFDGVRKFSETDRAFMVALAHQCAQALERARLYRDATAAEEESRRTAQRMMLLAELSQLFAEATTDYPRLLETIAKSVAARIRSTCSIRLLSEDESSLHPVALSDEDPVRQARLRSLVASSAPLRIDANTMMRDVVTESRPLLVPVVVGDLLEQTMVVADAEVYEALGIRSLIMVPLRSRGKSIGVFILARRGGASFDEADLALAQDLADRAALAIDNARLYQQATEAVRVRDDFLSVAGHELKTPLTALLLQVNSLTRAARGEQLPPKVADRADKAVQSGMRLAKLIDELLDVSRVSAGRLSLEIEEMDLAEVTREAVARCSDELARAECELRVVSDPVVTGLWDRGRTDQIVSNLLTNAIKYGRGKPIDVEIRQTETLASLVVRDYGIGIAPKDHARIFDRFERAVSTRHFGGLGLGLWIVRQIVEAHGGTIRVESAPGEGAVFRVELPRVPLCPVSTTPSEP